MKIHIISEFTGSVYDIHGCYASKILKYSFNLILACGKLLVHMIKHILLSLNSQI